MKSTLLSVALLLYSTTAGTFALAEEADHAALHVAHGWARASLGQNPNSAGYATIHNKSAEADTLLTVSCKGAARCQVHNHVEENGVSRMVHVKTLPIEPGAHLEFGPSGYHIMMFDLKERLIAGTHTEVAFTFEKAGELSLDLEVLSMKDAAERHGHSMHDAHQNHKNKH